MASRQPETETLYLKKLPIKIPRSMYKTLLQMLQVCVQPWHTLKNIDQKLPLEKAFL